MLFNAWRSQMFALSDSEGNHEPIYRRLAAMHECHRQTDDRRQTTTDRPMAIPPHWLASHESAKIGIGIDGFNLVSAVTST